MRVGFDSDTKPEIIPERTCRLRAGGRHPKAYLKSIYEQILRTWFVSTAL